MALEPDENAQPSGHPDQDLIDRLAAVSRAFRPSAPVDDRDLFAGRVDQLAGIFDVVDSPGRHGVVYGERGVGKTSLARVSELIVSSPFVVRVNCDGGDNFASIWQKVMDGFIELVDIDLVPAEAKPFVAQALEHLNYEEIGPDRVRGALRILERAGTPAPIIFIDEFDVVTEPGTRALFADTIKMLSDQLLRSTVILVGVADTVNELIEAHHSISRSLVQIHMPRMRASDIEDLLKNGFRVCKIRARPEALGMITRLSQGLPHYAHLLGQEAAKVVVYEGRSTLNSDHVRYAINAALNGAQQSVKHLYHKATVSPRPENLFEQVLTGCALVQGDEFGFFSPAEVRGPFSMIIGRQISIASFSKHLSAFCDEERGPVLERRGSSRRWRYRFTDPLIQPYTIMKGIASGSITAADIAG